jgi:hypothetical protein
LRNTLEEASSCPVYAAIYQNTFKPIIEIKAVKTGKTAGCYEPMT